MFIRFTLENFGAFRDEAVLDFEATSRRDSPDWRMPTPHFKHGVLPVIGLWGANASGKSTLIDALLFVRYAVENSHTSWPATKVVPWSPWRLRRGENDPPTCMELEFIVDEVRYAFGFKVAKAGFVEEWLYRWPENRRQVLYYRNHSLPEDEHFYAGDKLRGQRQAIWKITRANSLYLSAAAQQNHPQLLPVYRAIVEGIHAGRYVELQGYPVFNEEELILEPKMQALLLAVLKAADLGICGLQIEERTMGALPEGIGEIVGPDDLAELGKERDKKYKVVALVHKFSDGTTQALPPKSESSGTQVLLARIADLVRTLQRGELLVIDELEVSLHPDLCAVIVALFTERRTNPKGAQLLFSTHTRALMEILRTDEVVQVDKSTGSSTLAAASDYRGVRTRDDLVLAHHQGRIGGIPVLGDLRQAFEGIH